MEELEIGSVRELEDLIITHCFYPRLVSGKLDQQQGCLQARRPAPPGPVAGAQGQGQGCKPSLSSGVAAIHRKPLQILIFALSAKVASDAGAGLSKRALIWL